MTFPPLRATEAWAGETEKVQGVGCCDTAKFWPLMETSALRGVMPAFGATENGKAALPCPLVLPGSVIHDAPVVAVHWQSRSVVTCTVPVPPEGGKLAGLPASVTWQRGGVAPVTAVVVEEPQANPIAANVHSAISQINALR